jgi:hypothetical protein
MVQLYAYFTILEPTGLMNNFPIIKWTLLLFPIPVIIMDILITKYDAYRDLDENG